MTNPRNTEPRPESELDLDEKDMADDLNERFKRRQLSQHVNEFLQKFEADYRSRIRERAGGTDS